MPLVSGALVIGPPTGSPWGEPRAVVAWTAITWPTAELPKKSMSIPCAATSRLVCATLRSRGRPVQPRRQAAHELSLLFGLFRKATKNGSAAGREPALEGSIALSQRKGRLLRLLDPFFQVPVKPNASQKKKENKRGAKPGHPGAGRKVFDESQAERVLEVEGEACAVCTNCGGPLTDKGVEKRMVLESCPLKAQRVLYRCTQEVLLAPPPQLPVSCSPCPAQKPLRQPVDRQRRRHALSSRYPHGANLPADRHRGGQLGGDLSPPGPPGRPGPGKADRAIPTI